MSGGNSQFTLFLQSFFPVSPLSPTRCRHRETRSRHSKVFFVVCFDTLLLFFPHSLLSSSSVQQKFTRYLFLKDTNDKEHKDKDNTDTQDNPPNHPFGLSTPLRVQLQPCPLLAQPRDISIQCLICIIKQLFGCKKRKNKHFSIALCFVSIVIAWYHDRERYRVRVGFLTPDFCSSTRVCWIARALCRSCCINADSPASISSRAARSFWSAASTCA